MDINQLAKSGTFMPHNNSANQCVSSLLNIKFLKNEGKNIVWLCHKSIMSPCQYVPMLICNVIEICHYVSISSRQYITVSVGP